MNAYNSKFSGLISRVIHGAQRLCICFAVLVVLLALAGCGAGREQAVGAVAPGASGTVPPGPAPAGVNPDVLRQLNAELIRVLEEYGTAKRTSAAASGKGSIVPDLGLHIAGGQTVYTWSYRQHGDYDLNGIVNAADLVPVGIHFGKNTLGPDWQKAQLADGDYSGQITVADVAAIGQNFGGRIDGYELQRRPDSAQPWVVEAEVPLLPGSPVSGQYPQYTCSGPLMMVGPEFRVVPFTDAGGPRAYGTPGTLLNTKAGLPTHWYTTRGNPSRDGCASCGGPQDTSSTWELLLDGGLPSVMMAEPVADQYGTIYIGQSANMSLIDPEPGVLHAVSASGQLKWNYRTVDGVAMGAATNRLGRIVVGDLSGVVYCLAPDGKQYWRRQLAGLCAYGGSLLLDTGEVYILAHTFSGGNFTSSTLYKLNSDGTVSWSRGLNANCDTNLFLTAANQVCAVDTAGEFYCFDADGNSVYNYLLPDPPKPHLLAGGIACRNLVFAFAEPSTTFRIHALDNSLGVSNNLGTETPETMPAINSTGHFVLGSQDTGTKACKLNYYLGGAQQWEIGVSGDMLTNIAIDSADSMYFGTFLQSGASQAGNGISCVRSDQSTLWFYPTAQFMPLYCILASEKLLVCLTAELASDGQIKLIGIQGS